MTAHLILKAGEKRNCGGVEMVFVQMFQSSADQRVEVRNVAELRRAAIAFMAENRHKIEAPYVPSLTILAYGRKVAGYDASKLGILIEATK
jgi:hypothetical protein